MKMAELRAKAKGVGVDPGKMKKLDLVRSIQQAEGFNACYGSGNTDCPHTACCFMDDCMKESSGPVVG